MKEINFSLPDVYDLGLLAFPEGCPYCGSRIEFRPFTELFENGRDGYYAYVCSQYPGCDSYTRAHREDTLESSINEPVGIIADRDLRSIHEFLRSKFDLLWRDSKVIQSVYPDYVVLYDVNNEWGVGDVVNLDGGSLTYTIRKADHSTIDVPTINVKKVTYKTKAYYWLSKQLDMPYSVCKIPMLNREDTLRAIEIVDEVIKTLNKQTWKK